MLGVAFANGAREWDLFQFRAESVEREVDIVPTAIVLVVLLHLLQLSLARCAVRHVFRSVFGGVDGGGSRVVGKAGTVLLHVDRHYFAQAGLVAGAALHCKQLLRAVENNILSLHLRGRFANLKQRRVLIPTNHHLRLVERSPRRLRSKLIGWYIQRRHLSWLVSLEREVLLGLLTSSQRW